MPEYFSVIKFLKIKSLILEYDTGFAYSLQVDKGLCRATGITLPCQFLVDLELPSKANINLHLCWLRVLFLLQEGKKKRPLFNEDASISTWYCGRNWPAVVSLACFRPWSWQKTCCHWYWSDCSSVNCLINATEHPPNAFWKTCMRPQFSSLAYCLLSGFSKEQN